MHLKPGRTRVIHTHEGYKFYAISINKPHLCCALSNDKGKLTFSFQPTYVPLWQILATDYDFSNVALNAPYPDLDNVKEELRRHIDNRVFLFFRDLILPQAGINKIDFYNKISTMYTQNLPFIHQEIPLSKPTPQTYRIGLTIHTIWFTTQRNPKPLHGKKLLERTMQVCRPQDGWQYVVWYAESLTETGVPSDLLQGIDPTLIPFIKIKHPNNIDHTPIAPISFSDAFAKEQYGKASDIFRYEVLLEGGVYRDTDFEFIHSPEWLNQHLDFYSGKEDVSSTSAGNAMIGAKPNHPILIKALQTIEDNHNSAQKPAYLNNIAYGLVFLTLIETGPFRLVIDYYFACGQNGNRDVLLPPEVFFWTNNDNLFKSADETRNAKHKQAGIHYRHQLWIDKKVEL